MNATILPSRRLAFLALLWVLVFLLVLTLNWLLGLVTQEVPWHPVLRTAVMTAILVPMILAIPSKRFTRTLVHFLTRPEVDAMLAAPDQRTWSGRRDHAFLLVSVQTGLRLSEMTGLKREDITLLKSGVDFVTILANG